MTVKSFETIDHYEDITPNDEEEIFLIIDLTLKIIGDTPLEVDDLLKPMLFDDNEFRSFRTYDYDFIDSIKD